MTGRIPLREALVTAIRLTGASETPIPPDRIVLQRRLRWVSPPPSAMVRDTTNCIRAAVQVRGSAPGRPARPEPTARDDDRLHPWSGPARDGPPRGGSSPPLRT